MPAVKEQKHALLCAVQVAGVHSLPMLEVISAPVTELALLLLTGVTPMCLSALPVLDIYDCRNQCSAVHNMCLMQVEILLDSGCVANADIVTQSACGILRSKLMSCGLCRLEVLMYR